MGGNKTTISYQPVSIGGKYLWTLFVSAPHQLATEVGVLINNQKNFRYFNGIDNRYYCFGYCFFDSIVE